MNYQFKNGQLPTGNPLANILVVVVGILVISVSLALGFIVFVGIAGFMLVMAAIVTVRLWWAKRRFGAGKPDQTTQSAQQSSKNRVIEGEFMEIPTKRNTDREN